MAIGSSGLPRHKKPKELRASVHRWRTTRHSYRGCLEPGLPRNAVRDYPKPCRKATLVWGAGGRSRTCTSLAEQRGLSPSRLPVSPRRQVDVPSLAGCPILLPYLRRRRESNPRIAVLQTAALATSPRRQIYCGADPFRQTRPPIPIPYPISLIPYFEACKVPPRDDLPLQRLFPAQNGSVAPA